MNAAEWWSIYGVDTPTLRSLAVRILSQTVASSACEWNWSTFALIHTKQRNRLAHTRLKKLVYCSYNMKLLICDRKAEWDNVLEQDPLVIIQKSSERMGDKDDDIIIDWIRPAYLDNLDGNPDPNVAEDARAAGVDVDQVLSEEVDTQASGSTGHTGGDHVATRHDDTNGNDDDGGGEDQVDARGEAGGTSGGYMSQESERQRYMPWTEEQHFDHAIQDVCHSARDAGSSRSRSSSHRGRQHGGADKLSSNMSISGDEDDVLSMSFASLGIGSHSEHDSNSIGDPSSYDPYSDHAEPSFDQPQVLHTIVYEPVPVILEPPVHFPIRVYDAYPIHGVVVRSSQQAYDHHLSSYIINYAHNLTWYQYCIMTDTQSTTMDPPRSSFWY